MTLVESQLTAGEDEVYTEYEIDVSRVFRRPASATRALILPADVSPVDTDAPPPQPTPTTRQRVRLRQLHNGRVVLDGGVLTVTSDSPSLNVGQQVIVSAYFDESRGWWMVHGVFEVKHGRVLHLDKRLQTKDYESVEEFAAAIADPPPTIRE